MIKKILWGLLILILLLVVGGYAYYRFIIYEPPLISDQNREQLTVMPLPAKMEFTGEQFTIHPTFGVSVEGEAGEKLVRAVSRFKSRLSMLSGISFNENGDFGGMVIVNNELGKPYPTGDEDESYELRITDAQIELQSNSEYGAIRGLETILQLVDGTTIPTLELEDSPRFKWRGLMIDVSRHWMPKPVILRNLDAMAAVKMNVLHLHLSDDQGFRLESKSFPRLHEVGSNGHFFTQEEMKEIIDYAADRGIRIIPEFDVPGHTKSWLIAYPGLASVERDFRWGQDRNEGLFTVPMDPTRDETYEFLDTFFAEMAELFPDPYMHIGGDEVNPYYWEENERIREFMNQNNLDDAHELQAYFNQRMGEILSRHGKKMIGWDEIINPDLPGDVIVQSWRNQKTLFEAVQQGYFGVLSAGLYLDHKLHADEHYSVDPFILPGAVQIEPDSSHWRMFDITMEIPGGGLDTELVIFDRDPNNVFGYFAFIDQRSAFTNGTLEDNQLTFDFEAGNVGELTFEAEISGDSLDGSVSLGFLSFNADGHLTGGDNIPDSEMPEVEIIEPLTDDDKERILGGEAAMWSEVVSAQTIDSRIWPRTAAIAEKLWSPSALTTNVDDMYRRLQVVSEYLDRMGLRHIFYQEELLQQIGGEAYEPLKELVSILEEAKYYTRHRFLTDFDHVYLPDVQMNYIADAAKPESMEARDFNKLVDEYFENPTEEQRRAIISHLETWSGLHDKLGPYFDDSDRLRDVEELSMKLAEISKILINKLESGNAETNQTEAEEILAFLEQGEHGVVVAVVPGLRRILAE